MNPFDLNDPKRANSNSNRDFFRTIMDSEERVKICLEQNENKGAAFGAAQTALREAVFEAVREKDFNELPCRFKTVMLFDNVQHATNFKKNYRAGGYLYEVEVSAPEKMFVGDMQWLHFDLDDKNPAAKLKELAKNYWAGKKTDNPILEYLTYKGQTVQVIQQLPS